MAVSLPYLSSNKNVETLFTKIQSAKIPDRFSQDFLKTTIGLKGSNDRALIPLLRALGFVDQTGAPTTSYRLLKNSDTAKRSLGKAIRKAYAPLFEANESANTLASDKLKGLIAQVAGTDDEMTSRIAQTFNALVKAATFEEADTEDGEGEDEDQIEEEEDDEERPPADGGDKSGFKVTRSVGLRKKGPLQAGFHYDIHVHLPSNGTEDVYLNIFNALRKSFE
jgi:hypothetical protein